MRRLVLFDIDGTLLSAGRISKEALREALLGCFSLEGDMESYDFSGKTDPQIVRELMGRSGVSEETIAAKLATCLALYRRILTGNLKPADVVAKSGVGVLLERLETEEGVSLGLLTGNLEECARAKLAPLDWNHYFPFGAYGSDHEDRHKLPRVAVQRAYEKTGYVFEGKAIVVVGDSIHDVRCGRALSVRSVAVASGKTTAADLAKESPDSLLPDFQETRAALEAILGP